MNKLIYTLSIVLFSLLIISPEASAQSLNAQLKSVSYYSKSTECNGTQSILVRVKYKVDFDNPQNLMITHRYANGSQISLAAEKIDKTGNIVYDFCINTSYREHIVTVFKTEDGSFSNEVHFRVDAQESEVTSGTPPRTLKIQQF